MRSLAYYTIPFVCFIGVKYLINKLHDHVVGEGGAYKPLSVVNLGLRQLSQYTIPVALPGLDHAMEFVTADTKRLFA